MKDLSSRFSQSFDLLLFQIFSEISQSHIALLQEGIVHGEGGTHALWLVALLGKLQILIGCSGSRRYPQQILSRRQKT